MYRLQNMLHSTDINEHCGGFHIHLISILNMVVLVTYQAGRLALPQVAPPVERRWKWQDDSYQSPRVDHRMCPFVAACLRVNMHSMPGLVNMQVTALQQSATCSCT